MEPGSTPVVMITCAPSRTSVGPAIVVVSRVAAAGEFLSSVMRVSMTESTDIWPGRRAIRVRLDKANQGHSEVLGDSGRRPYSRSISVVRGGIEPPTFRFQGDDAGRARWCRVVQ